MPQLPRIALAANRELGFNALELLLQHEMRPAALLVPLGRASDAWTEKMVARAQCDSAGQPTPLVLRGKQFREAPAVAQLADLQLDYLLSVHFPYVVPQTVLGLPRVGALNLHPAWLPYNRGWHTPSWAIMDGTPYGATLHWMDEGLDTGDLALRRQVHPDPCDTAHGLYLRVLAAEYELLQEALPLLIDHRLPRIPQGMMGTTHRKEDLIRAQRLELHKHQSVGQTLRQLRALTTNSWEEAAYFEEAGQRYRVQVTVRREQAPSAQPRTRDRAA